MEVEHPAGALGKIAGNGDRRVDPERIVVEDGPRAAVDDDIVGERRIAAGEGQVAVSDRDRPAGPSAKGRPTAARNRDVGLVVDLDVADDLTGVGDRPDRGVRAGAIDGVARRSGRRPFPPGPPAMVPLLVSAPMVPELAIPAPPAPPMNVGEPPPPPPPLIAPELLSVVIAPAFPIPTPRPRRETRRRPRLR